jgi:hypothetical protein
MALDRLGVELVRIRVWTALLPRAHSPLFSVVFSSPSGFLPNFPSMTVAPKPTIGELEAGYSGCCKALRLLIREGRSLEAIKRTVAWDRLSLLHSCLPTRYKAPDYLYALLKREVTEAV